MRRCENGKGIVTIRSFKLASHILSALTTFVTVGRYATQADTDFRGYTVAQLRVNSAFERPKVGNTVGWPERSQSLSAVIIIAAPRSFLLSSCRASWTADPSSTGLPPTATSLCAQISSARSAFCCKPFFPPRTHTPRGCDSLSRAHTLRPQVALCEMEEMMHGAPGAARQAAGHSAAPQSAPAPAAAAANDDEEDALDAFMAGINADLKKPAPPPPARATVAGAGTAGGGTGGGGGNASDDDDDMLSFIEARRRAGKGPVGASARGGDGGGSDDEVYAVRPRPPATSSRAP